MPLKILVTAKRVEDPESKIKVKPDGSGHRARRGVKYKINPFDEIAVEEALRLVAKHQGEVVVASRRRQRGPGAAAPRAGHGRRPGGLGEPRRPARPQMVAALLVKVAEKEKPDLVILGKQSIDDDQNQVGQYLAEWLGWAQATFASKAESLRVRGREEQACRRWSLVDGRQGVKVVREVDGGLATLEVRRCRRWSPPTCGSTCRATPRCRAS